VPDTKTTGLFPPFDLAQRIADELIRIDGVLAVVLGGSWARGDARPDSDIDLGIYYRPEQPPSLDALRNLAAHLDDRHSGEVVTDFGEWGPWINGGGWLRIEGQPVDWLYRDYRVVEQIIDECRAGNPRVFYQVGHPHGFWTPIYIGEVHLCKPLRDPQNALADLKALADPYPPALKTAMIQRNLWDVSGGLFRCAACLVQVMFALNERYCINEKGALKLAATFPLCPPDFESTITDVLAHPGHTPDELSASLQRFDEILEATRKLVTP